MNLCTNMTLRTFLVLGLLLVLQLQIAVAHKAAYFITNEPAGNNIVSLKIDSKNGSLSSPVLTPTGGKGGLGLMNASSGEIASPDTLFSAGSVVVEGNLLFAVNAGSNTLSLFYIPEHDPSCPILVGKPADTLGEFPISVAYSSKLEAACVLNAGKKAGVACYNVSTEGLIPIDTSLRSFAGHYNQTTPPVGQSSTATEVLFNPSSTALFAILKGAPATPPGLTPSAPATPSPIYVWPVVEGKVSSDPVISLPPKLIWGFGGVFLGGDDLLYVTDGLAGGELLDVSPSLELTAEALTVIPGVGAPCWVNYDPKFESLYVLSSLFNNFTVVDPKSAAIKGYVPFPAIAIGSYDADIDEGRLYVLMGDTAVFVFELHIDVEKIKLVQQFDLSSLGSRTAWQGMAIFHGRP